MFSSIIKVLFYILILTSCSYAFTTDSYPDYKYRVWGVGGSEVSSKTMYTIDKQVYTIVSFSKIDLKKTNTSLSGEFSSIALRVEQQRPTLLVFANNYHNKEIVLKIYKSKSIFDESTLVYTSNPIYMYSETVDFKIDLGELK